MTFRVELAGRAIRDLAVLYEEKNVTGSAQAARWFNGLERAVYSLASDPLRCPVAPECLNTKNSFRHLLYGKKPHVYRIVFAVDHRRSTVFVLTVRHAARHEVAPDASEN